MEPGATQRRGFAIVRCLGRQQASRGASGTAGGRAFALGVWLLGKVRLKTPDASGRKQVAPRQNEPGRKYPELEFTLSVPGTSGGQGAPDGPGCRVVSLLMPVCSCSPVCFQPVFSLLALEAGP